MEVWISTSKLLLQKKQAFAKRFIGNWMHLDEDLD